MYYSYVEIEYVDMSFSPARTDLAVKLLRQKCFTDTGCACTSSVAGKRAVIKRLAKNIFPGKNAYPLVMYTSAL